MNPKLRAEIDAADHKGADIFFAALTRYMDDWGPITALDMFARNGDLTIRRYIHAVKDIDAWELNAEHEHALESFNPRDILIGCSFDALAKTDRMYDLVVVDSPQGLYTDGDGNVRVEHFDVIPKLAPILNDRAIVVVYVNMEPYDKAKAGHYGNDEYAQYNFTAWMAHREKFYGVPDGRKITEEQAVGAYKNIMERQGFDARNVLLTPCVANGLPGLPPSFRLALELRRK